MLCFVYVEGGSWIDTAKFHTHVLFACFQNCCMHVWIFCFGFSLSLSLSLSLFSLLCQLKEFLSGLLFVSEKWSVMGPEEGHSKKEQLKEKSK